MQRALYDVIVVGGGLLGTATARELLLRNPLLKLALVEKENSLAFHQSGHNSGVIHSGIYYTPGSLKAKLCVEGLDLTYKYCVEKNIPFKKCGKLIVAVDKSEVARLVTLYNRAIENKVKEISLLDGDGIKALEPHVKGLFYSGWRWASFLPLQNAAHHLHMCNLKTVIVGFLLIIIFIMGHFFCGFFLKQKFTFRHIWSLTNRKVRQLRKNCKKLKPLAPEK